MAKPSLSDQEIKSLIGSCTGCGKIPHSNKCMKTCGKSKGQCRKQKKNKGT